MLPSRSTGAGSVRGWEGTLMSIFSNQVGDWEGGGYGSLLYTPSVGLGWRFVWRTSLRGQQAASVLCCAVLCGGREGGGGGGYIVFSPAHKCAV